MKHRPASQDSLISRLVEEFGLLELADRACARAGIPGREQPLAYCLVVLAGKADPARSKAGGQAERTYRLDPEAVDFPERLEAWAGVIARNLRAWAPVYDAIHDEADRYELTTLRGLIQARRFDDIADRMALELTLVLAGGPRLDEMSLALAREGAVSPRDYVFQTPLRRWVATSVVRVLPRDTDSLDDHVEVLAADDLVTTLETAAEEGTDVLAAYIAQVAALAGTRGLLADAITRADAFEVTLARLRPSSGQDPDLVTRIRAALVHEADQLQREQRAVDNMLAYVVLAMRVAPKLQRVVVLSLRLAGIDRLAVESLAVGMRRVVDDERQPTPRLVRLTQAAAVPKSRSKALAAIRTGPERRAAAMDPVARMLDELPPIVADLRAIAKHEQTDVHVVEVNRSSAAGELTAVDAVFGQVFRRYAMGRT